MELFLRITGRDFRAGPRATNKATMCPEIIQIRKLRSLPQDRANADRLRPGRAIESRRSKSGHGLVAAQQELESKNRGLCAQVGASELAHQHVREQAKPAEAVVATRREPTHQDLQKGMEVVGLGEPMEYLVKSGVEGMPAYHLREKEYQECQQGRGPAWEEEQRRKREEEQKNRPLN
jgi:hypothetical protein